MSFLCEEELKAVLACMGTTQSICWRDNTKINLTQQALVFGHMLTGTVLLLSEYYTALKSVTPCLQRPE
jgi:hypothetical protein